MESTPVSRASFGIRCGGIRLQSSRRIVNLDAVCLVFLFSPLSSDKVKEPCQPLFFALTEIPMGWLWIDWFWLLRRSLCFDSRNRQVGESTLSIHAEAGSASRLVCPEADRWKHFGPGKVRNAIKTAGSEVPIDETQYSWLCGVGVHVNPETTPQTHNKEKQPHLGAFFQHDGHTKAIANLGWCLFITLGVIAKNANVDRIHKDEMKKAWKKLGEVLGNHPELSSGS